jgi:adenylate kinase
MEFKSKFERMTLKLEIAGHKNVIKNHELLREREREQNAKINADRMKYL